MLIHPTTENLRNLKLFGMARAMEAQMHQAEALDIPFEDRVGLLVDAELALRENLRLKSRLKTAKIRLDACVEDVNLRAPRSLDKTLWSSLCSCQWLMLHQNILISGPTGVGKSYIACALAQKACREGHSSLYQRSSRLFHDLAVAKATGRYNKLLSLISKKALLVIDDFALETLNDEQRRDLLEITDDRYEKSSTIIVSQLPIENWHDTIGDPTIADAILDRVVHNSHRLILKGESMRKSKGPK